MLVIVTRKILTIFEGKNIYYKWFFSWWSKLTGKWSKLYIIKASKQSIWYDELTKNPPTFSIDMLLFFCYDFWFLFNIYEVLCWFGFACLFY